MLQRFSFFSKIPYDTSLIQRVTSGQNNNVQDILRAQVQSNVLSADIVSQSNFYAGRMVADSNFESANIITDSIGKSTESLSSKLDNVALSQIFGSLMTVGAIAVSTTILTKKLNVISTGIQRLGPIFSEGMSLISSQLDIQTNSLVEIRDQLGKIYETLKSPLITQASEWQRIGLERFSTGLIPEAKDAFQKAVELDTTDPVSNMMLGKIYLDGVDKEYNFHNPVSASDYFNKAIRYSYASINKAPKLKDIYEESLYFYSTALLAASVLISGNNGNHLPKIYEALNQIDLLLNSNPQHIQGRYFRAKLLLILGKEEEAAKEIFDLLNKDLNLISLPLADEDFTKYSPTGVRILSRIELFYKNKLQIKLEEVHSMLDKMVELKCDIPNELVEWLKKEGLKNREAVLYTLNSFSLRELTDKIYPTYHILEIAIQGLTNILDLRKAELCETLQKRKKEVQSLFYYIDRNFLDDSDVQSICGMEISRFSRKIQDSQDQLVTVDEYFPKIMELNEFENKIKELNTTTIKDRNLFESLKKKGNEKLQKKRTHLSHKNLMILSITISLLGMISAALANNQSTVVFISILLILTPFFALIYLNRMDKIRAKNIKDVREKLLFELESQLNADNKSESYIIRIKELFAIAFDKIWEEKKVNEIKGN